VPQVDNVFPTLSVRENLEMGAFTRDDDLGPTFQRYLESIKGYRKNPHRFDADTLDKVDDAWGPWLQRWGYTRPDSTA